MIKQFGADFYPAYILDSLKSEVVQEHQMISLDTQTRGCPLSQSELRPGRVLEHRPHKTRDGSKRSKKSSGSLRTNKE